MFLDTYEEALKKIERLETEKHVFSVDSEENEEEKCDKIVSAIKAKELINQLRQIQKVFNDSTCNTLKTKGSNSSTVNIDNTASNPKKRKVNQGIYFTFIINTYLRYLYSINYV